MPSQQQIVLFSADRLVLAAITEHFVVTRAAIEVILEILCSVTVVITLMTKNPVVVYIRTLNEVIACIVLQYPFICALEWCGDPVVFLNPSIHDTFLVENAW